MGGWDFSGLDIKKIVDKYRQGVVGLVGMKVTIFCPVCGKVVKSGRKYCCYDHSTVAINESIKQIRDRKGPIYDKWKIRLIESIRNL